MLKKNRRKCITYNCLNHTDEGGFVGELCTPCYRFITTGKDGNSQVFRNILGILSNIIGTGLKNHRSHYCVPK